MSSTDVLLVSRDKEAALGHHEGKWSVHQYSSLSSFKPSFIKILVSSFTAYITTTAITHGPEYYQALLAQPENKIIKPKRTPGTQDGVIRMRKQWIRYYYEILQMPLNPFRELFTQAFIGVRLNGGSLILTVVYDSIKIMASAVARHS